MNEITESTSHLLARNSTIEGAFKFQGTLRFEGKIKGSIEGEDGSHLILCQSSVVEGNIAGDSILIRGYVEGDIEAKSTLRLERTARVIGNLKAPTLSVEPGATWEGRSNVNAKRKLEAPVDQQLI